MVQICILIGIFFALSCSKNEDTDKQTLLSVCRTLPMEAQAFDDQSNIRAKLSNSFEPSQNSISGSAEDGAKTESSAWVLGFGDRENVIAERAPGFRFQLMRQHFSPLGTAAAHALGFTSRVLSYFPSFSNGQPLGSYIAEQITDLYCSAPEDCSTSKQDKVREETTITSWDEQGIPTAGASILFENGVQTETSTYTMKIDYDSRTASLDETVCEGTTCRQSSTQATWDKDGNLLNGKTGFGKATGNLLLYRFPELRFAHIVSSLQTSGSLEICPNL